MPSSTGFHQLAAVFRGATGRLVAVVAVILTCLLAANAFGQFKHSQTIAPVAGNPERYEIATALYARLATLPQPVSVSDVARLLNNFIQDDSLVAGATLVDTRNQLMVQVGAGNESLALDTLPVNSGHVPTAKIPVTSEGQPFATVVVTFKGPSDASFTWLLYSAAGIVILMILVFAYIELRRYGPLSAPAPS